MLLYFAKSVKKPFGERLFDAFCKILFYKIVLNRIQKAARVKKPFGERLFDAFCKILFYKIVLNRIEEI
jgi:hypothetical protein